jgi:small subunit ribosomal protein S7
MRKIYKKKYFVTKDLKYNSFLVTLLINKILKKGKKEKAKKIVYNAFDYIIAKNKIDPLLVFEKAIRNVSPKIKLKKKIINGISFKVPYILKKYHSINLAINWIVFNSQKRIEKTMFLRLANELLDSSNNFGNSIKKKEEIYKIAEFNKAFV